VPSSAAYELFAIDVDAGALPAEDQSYQTKIASKRSGPSKADTGQCVDDVYAHANEFAAVAKGEQEANEA
jgi:hypothetical protein